MKRVLKVLLGLVIFLGLGLNGHGAQVEQFSPQGMVKEVRQVTARFSEPMVPFGDPRLADPFTVSCPVKGKGRWVDGRTWAFDFEKDLPAGLVCEFRLKPEQKTLAGKEISGARVFAFNTGGPSIKESRPYEGNNWIDEHQIFIVTLDTEADEESILKNAYFSVERVQERVGLRILKGSEKEALFKALAIKKPKGATVAFQCKQAFPPGSEVKIIWEKGSNRSVGSPPGKTRSWPLKPAPLFRPNLSGPKKGLPPAISPCCR